jgi:hypothetical protein
MKRRKLVAAACHRRVRRSQSDATGARLCEPQHFHDE